MITKTIMLSSHWEITSYDKIAEVLTRMGWCFDSKMVRTFCFITVNLPIDDIPYFELLRHGFLVP